MKPADILLTLILILGLSDSLAAQARPRRPAKPFVGAVEGDVYLVMQSGDAKKAPGQQVFLLKDSPELRLDLITMCSTYHLKVDLPSQYVAALQDSIRRDPTGSKSVEQQIRLESLIPKVEAARGAVYRDLFANLATAAIDTTSSGVSAHYRFENIPFGNYVIFGQWAFSDRLYQWWAPFALGDAHETRDLDNTVEASRALSCGTKAP